MSLGGDSPRDALSLSRPTSPPPPSSHSTNPLPPGEDILGVAEEGQEHGNLINECGPLPVSLAPRRLPEAPAVRDFKWQDIDTRRAKRLGLSVCAWVCVPVCVCVCVCVCGRERNRERKFVLNWVCMPLCECASASRCVCVCVCVCVCGPQRNVAPWI